MTPKDVTAILNEIDQGERDEQPVNGRPIDVRTVTGQFYENCRVNVLQENRYIDGSRNTKAPISILIIDPVAERWPIYLDVESIESIQRRA